MSCKREGLTALNILSSHYIEMWADKGVIKSGCSAVPGLTVITYPIWDSVLPTKLEEFANAVTVIGRGASNVCVKVANDDTKYAFGIVLAYVGLHSVVVERRKSDAQAVTHSG